MRINITGNVHLSSAIESYVKNKIENELAKNTVADNTEFTASFSKNGKNIKALVILRENAKRGLIIKAQEEAEDAYTAIDLAVVKAIKKMRKYKDKVNDYKKKIVALKDQKLDLPFIVVDRNIVSEVKPVEEEESEHIQVIETKQTEIEQLTIDEAIMKMDLLGLSGFAFLNKENKNTINFIYKRPDGNISWINPKNL